MGKIHGAFVVAKPERTGDYKPKEQIIYIEITDNMVDDCVRIDNTQNNRGQIEKFMNGEISKMAFDEYEDTKTKESLENLMSVADAICIS